MRLVGLCALLITAIVFDNAVFCSDVVQRKNAVIIGAGPAGITAGMMLNRLGWSTTIIERLPIIKTDNQKSYLYLIGARGQKILNDFNITAAIAEQSVSSLAFTSLTEFLSSGQKKVLKVPIAPPKPGTPPSYWIPRVHFLNTLISYVRNENSRNPSQQIEIRFDTKFVNMTLAESPQGQKIHVDVMAGSGESSILVADLVVGCDGINSQLRSCLSAVHGEKQFGITSYASDAAGLRYKMLSMNDGSLEERNEVGLAIRSLPMPWKNKYE
jgi:2-polyprenyl-6-methoxyphenol hydroxylase-like FAD-dependent oxidoreductase